MSVGTKLLQAAAGGGSDPVYVDDVFSTFLYTGKSDGTGQTINNGIDLSGEGGLVWTKSRTSTASNQLTDTVSGYRLESDDTAAGEASQGNVTFSSTGYSVNGSSLFGGSSTDYVGWTFRKAEKFFDIVTYTGDGTTSHTINHNLGSVPGMIIVKRTDASTNWNVWHRSSPVSGSGKTYDLMLNHPNAAGNSDFWPTTPTSTQFFLGDSDTAINASGGTYVAYLFGHNEAEYGQNSDEAIIYCDSFTTTSTWGNFKEEIGFEPQWILVKRTDSSDNWMILDMMRGVVGPGDQTLIDSGMLPNDSDDAELKANSNSAESLQGRGGFYSKGYIGNLGGFGNATYVYMAIRRPNKPASEFAATDLYTAAYMTSGPPLWNSNFPVGSGWYKQRAGTGSSVYLFSRLTDGQYMQTHSTGAESSAGAGQFDFQDGWYNSDQSATTFISWMFRRAKGFFDVVAYTGDGTSTSFSHNLGATPELKIIKIRSDAFGWLVGGSAVTGGTKDYQLYLDTNAAQANTNYWGAIDSASAFSVVASNFLSNASGQTYIAYLFATVAGISKVGSYTGTGSDLNVDCGFSAGAKFVVIKRTDSTGDWYLYDSARGIVAGNDPYKLLNSNAASVTNTDYIDPLSSGFTITSSAPAGLNASSGTYIFLAIA